ncbi:hypothetical protein TNCV_324681 [Trichonephila clavipes]|nr:hypothetical protein TNCV_324681 [Trichonephila clavipes]
MFQLSTDLACIAALHATRGLLVTRTNPLGGTPFFYIPPTLTKGYLGLDRLNVHRPPLHGGSSAAPGFELMTHQAYQLPPWIKRYGSCSVLATTDHGRDSIPFCGGSGRSRNTNAWDDRAIIRAVMSSPRTLLKSVWHPLPPFGNPGYQRKPLGYDCRVSDVRRNSVHQLLFIEWGTRYVEKFACGRGQYDPGDRDGVGRTDYAQWQNIASHP